MNNSARVIRKNPTNGSMNYIGFLKFKNHLFLRIFIRITITNMYYIHKMYKNVTNIFLFLFYSK